MMADMFEQVRGRVLCEFPALEGGSISALGRGLINQTFLVTTEGERFVLQRLATIFAPEINDNIAAVTDALAAAGLITPRLVPTRSGRRWVDLGTSGVWRVQTFVPGHSFDKVQSPAQAKSASELLARFHRAVHALDHRFVGVREGVHDTPKHLARLREALVKHSGHRLLSQVEPLAETVLARAEVLQPLPSLQPLIGHGDLKLNNVLFAGQDAPGSETAVCLIDLDTVGPVLLAHEIGDAWRSWCNPSGEDATKATVDLEVMAASFDGYAVAIGRVLAKKERLALLGGVEWISLELASRFAADALNESYFGWDPGRYPSRGDHNLVRARGQLALHDALMKCRAERSRLLGLGTSPSS
jgi:Ser/Thr protein kinase RdoA (MazF antagonist)